MSVKFGNIWILENGEPRQVTDILVWACWMEEHDEERVVMHTQIGDALLSTIFTGMDFSFGRGKPLLYETMILGGEHRGWQARYTTRAEAEAEHIAIAKELTNGNPPEGEYAGD